MSRVFTTLYGTNKDGSSKVWNISVEGGVVTTEYGKLGGKQTKQVSPPCESKNVGRSNETTSEEQALLEAQSKWQKQVDKGYTETIESGCSKTLPPLAKKYQENSKKVDWPWLGSVKMDGVRMTAFFKAGKVVFQSRGGKDYPVIREIADELVEVFFKENPKYVVDGELYCHGMFLEDTISAVKRHNDDTCKLNFHVFDLYDPNLQRGLRDRYAIYWDKLFDNVINTKRESRLNYVIQFFLRNEEELFERHRQAVEDGYEGIVLRDPKSLFKFNFRTSEFLKYKVALQEEFEVVRFEKDKNGGAVPVVTTKAGKEFKANFKGTHEFRRNLWENRESYVGKHLTVDFEAWSKYNVPLKPIGVAFRDVDLEGNPLV